MIRFILAFAFLAIILGFAFEPGFHSITLSQFFDMLTLLTFTGFFWVAAGG